MSGVHATQTRTEETPGCEAYLDTLYEILATGVEPPEGAALERIEGFLHEHARNAKSQEEFVAFFERMALEVRPPGEARAPLRVLEPLPAVEPPPPAFAEPVLPELEADVDDVTHPAIQVSARAERHSQAFSIVAALLLLGVGAILGWGYVAMSQLRADVARAQAQAADNRIAIEQVEERADEIRAQVDETAAVIRRFERKSDVLLDALLPAPVERP